MSVSREEVERIARLARLRLDDEEVDRLTRDMSRILEHAERLRDVDGGAGSDARPSDADADAASGTRPPEADRPDPLHAPLQDFAPDVRDGLFAVPPPPGVVAGGGEAPDDGGEA